MSKTQNGRHETEFGTPSAELWEVSRRTAADVLKRWGVALGIGGGVVAGVVGTLALAAARFDGDAASSLLLSNVGSGALFAVIPLLLFGAQCLDWLEKTVDGAPKSGPSVRRRRHLRLVGGAVVVAAAFAAPAARAQQTIFNVPSTDVLDRGKVYGELDVTWKPVDPKFSSFVPRVVVGTGGRVEVGLNVTGNITPGDDTTTLQPAFKWKAYDGGDNGWAVVVGDNLSLPVRNRPYDAGNYAYAEVSKILASGTRLTAGGYHFSKDVVAAAQRAGGQFGVEQTVNKYVSINADWFTGKHASGYFTPGVAFKPHPRVTGYVGYSIGNYGAGNNFVYTAVGINFN